MGKGDKQEREATNLFRDDGWFARRAATSGGGTSQASYDIMAAKDGTLIIGEVKYADPEYHIYVEESEVEGLEWCAEHMDAIAVLIARWKQDTTYYAYYPSQLKRTDEGSYRITTEDRGWEAFTLPPEPDELPQ